MIFSEIKLKNIFIIILGAVIVSFGIYNVHDVAHITEGGILGFDLLLEHWFNISPSYTNFVMTAVCFFIGWKALGKIFIVYSAVGTGVFSLSYFIFEHTPRLFPQIVNYPWLASLTGALFVGIGTGLSISAGGAMCGDDALAMAFNKFFGAKIWVVYLISDVTVLLLSLTYIPVNEILCSLLTVVLSGQIIEMIVKFNEKNKFL